MLDYYMTAMKKYVLFQGRSRRSEYWYFYLVQIIMAVVAGFADGLLGLSSQTGTGPIGGLISLVHLLPTIAAGIRRMHDINHSGWWLLVPLYNIYLLAKNGDVGSNRFGADPKGPAGNVADTFN
jgi:uncharacterized membrane protein YhaH (DUF805 family)